MKYPYLIPSILAAAVLTSCSTVSSVSDTSSDVMTAPVSTEVTTVETTIETVTTTTEFTEDETDADITEPTREFLLSDVGADIPYVSAVTDGNSIIESGKIRSHKYTLTVDLTNWAGKTSPEQINVLSELFWECYPRMYERFGTSSNAPTDVVLAIENEGYSPANTSGNFIHLHDEWLGEYKDDYDCITHELAHVIQNGWDETTCEYSDYIERFADFCRYEYAFRNGLYNDSAWTLWTAEYENQIYSSNRFFVWLDYTYSTPENDIMLNFFRVCYQQKYTSDQWDLAWQEIFSGSALDGRTISDVWSEYVGSDFAKLSAQASDGTSELLSRYDIRGKLS